MKIGIMQPYFLPYIGYFQLIKNVDKYVIYDDVNYINKGWINRNNILLNSQKYLFTLSLSGASQNKLINEIFVEENQSKLLKTLETAYKKAPYFEKVFPVIQNIFDFEDKNLAKFVGNSIMQIADYLNIKTEFTYSSEINKDNTLKAQEKILNICKALNATNYINAIGGQELYDKEIFKQNNIKLNFLKTEIVEYKQFKGDFVPYLSVLDVLMFNSAEEINIMLDKFELI